MTALVSSFVCHADERAVRRKPERAGGHCQGVVDDARW